MSNLPITQVLVDFTDNGAPPGGRTTSSSVALEDGDGRSISSLSCSRGRTHEVGNVQAGTCTAQVFDPEETLNPANALSPFQQAPNALVPYRSLAVRAWWPTTGNMVNSGTYGAWVSSSFAVAGVTNGWATTTADAGTFDLVEVTPEEGGTNLRLVCDGPAVTASPLTDVEVIGTTAEPHYWMIAGRPHTYSVYVRVDAASTGTEVWLEAEGETSAVTSSTTFVRLSVTFTPSLQRTPIVLHVEGGASGTDTQTVYLDNEQLELGETATEWVADGPVRYTVWTGYVERWPLQWEDRGYRGTRPLEGVDALAVLARTEITESYASVVEEDGYSLYLPLDEEAPPGRGLGQLAGTVRMLEHPSPKGGAYGWAGATLPDGSKAIYITQQLQNPADLAYADQVTHLDSRLKTGGVPTQFAVSTRGATVEFWLKIESGQTRADFRCIRNGNFNGVLGVGNARIGLGDAGYNHHVLVAASEITGEEFEELAFLRDWDEGWHYVAIAFESDPDDSSQFRIRWRLDDESATTSLVAAHMTIPINTIAISPRSASGDEIAKVAVGRVAFYPRALSNTRMGVHYRRGIGYLRETAQERADRLLTDWWGGGHTVHEGASRPLGPDFRYAGGNLLSALEDTALADGGLVYASDGGVVTVESSLTRHSQTGPAYTFGEDAENGELPYQGVRFDYDPTQLYSRVSVSRPGRSDPFELTDPEVEALVGPRTFSQSVNVSDDFELEQVARTLLHRYGQARLRVKGIALHPHANPDLWSAVLGNLDVSLRVRVRRRTSVGVTMAEEFYVESVAHDVDKDASTWECRLELSPVFVPSAWVLGDAERGVLGSTTAPVH